MKILHLIAVGAALLFSSMGWPEDVPKAPDAEPEGVLTLPDALALALEKSPQLAAFSWDIRAAEARILQARLRPNPELEIEIEGIRWDDGPASTSDSLSLGGALPPSASIGWERERERGAPSGFGEAELTITLSQLIELGGKRAKRIRLAQRDKDVAAWDYEIARADVLAQVAKTFVGVVAGQERVELRRELERYAKEVERSTSARVEAGKISPLELKKARIELASAQIEAQRAGRELEAARVQLAATWGSTTPTFERAAGRLSDISPLPPLDDLRTRAREIADVARWEAEIEKREAAVRLEKANRIPSVTLGAGFKTEGHEPGRAHNLDLGLMTGGVSAGWNRSRSSGERENSLVLGFSLPLPLFNRNQGAIQEAKYLVSKATEESRAANINVQSALADWYAMTLASYEEVRALEAEVLPEAAETFELTQEGFRQGKFNYLDVLYAQRTLIELRVQSLAAQAAHHQGIVEIERLTGESIHARDESQGTGIEED